MRISSPGCHAPSIPLQPYKGFQDAEASSDYLERVVGKRRIPGGMFMENSPSPCPASITFHMVSAKRLQEPTKPLETPGNLWAS